MSEYRIAFRYAKALLDLAVEQQELEEVNKDMVMCSSLIQQNREFLLVLKSPIITHDKKLAILNKLFEGRVSKLTLALLQLLAKKEREAYLPQITREFQHQYNLNSGIAEATVTTTFPLNDALKADFKKVAAQISNKKSVALTEVVDEALIGGFILKIGDRQIDDSVHSKLKALRVEFTKNPYEKAL